jgi:hypothetical protein
MTASEESDRDASALEAGRPVLDAYAETLLSIDDERHLCESLLTSGHLDARTAALTAGARARQVIDKPFDYLQPTEALADVLRARD